MFNDEKFKVIDTKWDKYHANVIETGETAGYSKLMVETFPVIYKYWNDDKEVVNKDVAAVIATMSMVFRVFDEDWNEFVDDENISDFHRDFLQALVYDRVNLLNSEGMIEIDSSIYDKWIVDPKTFEITDDSHN